MEWVVRGELRTAHRGERGAMDSQRRRHGELPEFHADFRDIHPDGGWMSAIAFIVNAKKGPFEASLLDSHTLPRRVEVGKSWNGLNVCLFRGNFDRGTGRLPT